MKSTTLLLLFSCLIFIDVRADEPTGIKFFTGSWQDVLTESRRQNKPIFVDFYTNWCPPCRRMAREAFPNVTIGAKFNEHFISYQVNAEIGEGTDLAKRYAVQSYPTALYIIPTGELVHRAVGYAGVKAMLQQANMVLSMREVRRSRRKRISTDNPVSSAIPKQIDSIQTDSIRD
ncbi:thioredoxin family protein [Spirosoma validum]|uniref:Thioredoxin family protein n=1 Tax=Spirosoma validum TaxID=2771355 RepID=A0A927B8G6_9BACT|nr:thioredoxin family protein [Spirosoma validum]MBD2757655.1 thioredoxin family protein [Spirosoma validum]